MKYYVESVKEKQTDMGQCRKGKDKTNERQKEVMGNERW